MSTNRNLPSPVTSVVSNVPADVTTAKRILGANQGRRGVIFYNAEATAVMRLLFGDGATAVSATNFSVAIPAGQSFRLGEDEWAGPVFGIWSATGSAGMQVTEFK